MNPRETRPVDNSIYELYGERWYTANDDPVALLRAESKAILSWLESRFEAKRIGRKTKLLDVGCGAGFLTNPLALRGHRVTGLDISATSLATAKRHDPTGLVNYVEGDAYRLPFANGEFDVVTSMDFLEHVDDPRAVVAEVARVLRPGGHFFFHTFNRNLVSHLVVIKMVEWLVKNTPKDMHVLHLFIKPRELKRYCEENGMSEVRFFGIRPDFASIPLKSVWSGIVPTSLRFKLTRSTMLSYLGEASKLL